MRIFDNYADEKVTNIDEKYTDKDKLGRDRKYNFGKYSKSFIDNQAKMMSDLYDKIDKRLGSDRAESIINSRIDKMEQSLRDWDAKSKQVYDNLSLSERLSIKMFKFNRAKEIEKLRLGNNGYTREFLSARKLNRLRHNVSVNGNNMRYGTYIKDFTSNYKNKMNSFYDGLDKYKGEDLEEVIKDRFSDIEDMVNQFGEVFNEIEDDLSETDRLAALTFYKNRKKELKKLDKESKKRYKSQLTRMSEFFHSFSEKMDDISSELRDWSSAFYLDDLSKGAEETADSLREIRIDLAKNMELTSDTWKDIKESAMEFSDSTGNAISSLDYLDKFRDIIKSGVNNVDLAKQYAEVMTKFEDMTDVGADSMEKVFSISRYLDDPNYLKNVTSSMMALQRTTDLRVTAKDLTSNLDDNLDNFKALANGNKELIKTYTDQSVALMATLKSSDYNDKVADKLYEIMNKDSTELLSDTGLMRLGGLDIQKLMRKGDFQSAAKMLIENVQSVSKQYGNNKELLSAMGLDPTDDYWTSIIGQGDYDKFLENNSKVMDIIHQQAKSSQKFIDTYEPEVTMLDKLSNWWKSSSVGSMIEDITSKFDMTLGEFLLLGAALSKITGTIGKILTKIPFLGKGLTKIFGLLSLGKFGKIFGGLGSILGLGGSTAASAATSAVGSGASIAGKGLFSSVAGALGSTATGLGASALGAGAVAGGAIGALSIGSGIYDLATAKDQATLYGKQTKQASGLMKIGGTAATAAAGAVIGSIIPGVGTLIGGLIGAGVGGAATLLFGDDWAEKLVDTVKGIRKVKASIKDLNKASENLSKTLETTKSTEQLVQRYKDLRNSLSGLAEGSADYYRVSNQLKSVIADLSASYPELFKGMKNIETLNKDILNSTDTAIKAVEQLTESEKKLAWARMSAAADNFDATKDLVKKLEESSSDASKLVDGASNLNNGLMQIQDYLDKGYLKNEGNKFTVTDEGKKVGIEENYKKLMGENGSIVNDYFDADLDGWSQFRVDYLGKNKSAEVRRGILLKDLLDKFSRNELQVDGSDEVKELQETQQLASDYLKSLSGGMNKDEILNLAKDYNNLNSSQQAFLKKMTKHYDMLSKAKGYDIPTDIIPSTKELELAAGVDLNGDNKVPNLAESNQNIKADGSHSVGLDYVPFDNYIAKLHKGESVLTKDEADNWRQDKDSSETLSNILDKIIKDNREKPKKNTPSEVKKEKSDATLSDIVNTLKWAVKELKNSIEESAEDDTDNLVVRSMKSPAGSQFGFFK